MTDVTMVFPRGVVPPVMRPGFDAPIVAHQGQHCPWAGFLRRQTEHAITGLAGGLDHHAWPQAIHLLVKAENLRGAGQPEQRSGHGLTAELARFHPPVAFSGRLRLRGEIAREELLGFGVSEGLVALEEEEVVDPPAPASGAARWLWWCGPRRQ